MIWKMGEKTCLFNSAYRPQIQQSRAKQVVESIKSFSSHNYLLTYLFADWKSFQMTLLLSFPGICAWHFLHYK